MTQGKKIAVLFPGIGYTCDKPLLYYAGKLAIAEGYELVSVRYGNFPPDVKGNREKMQQSYQSALRQARDILKEVNWSDYDDILFISKSIGTVVSSAYAMESNLKVRNILYTPLDQTFLFANTGSIAFHGTKDPWAVTDEIEDGCRIHRIPLHITEGANHSLETGDVMEDLKNLKKVMRTTLNYIQKKSK